MRRAVGSAEVSGFQAQFAMAILAVVCFIFRNALRDQPVSISNAALDTSSKLRENVMRSVYTSNSLDVYIQRIRLYIYIFGLDGSSRPVHRWRHKSLEQCNEVKKVYKVYSIFEEL